MNYVNSEPKFPIHPDPILLPGPVQNVESLVNGVPIKIVSEIKSLLSESIDTTSVPDLSLIHI